MAEERTWWKEAVIYQIYPRSFADSNGDGVGDLNGITEHLEYLKRLGIDVIWLSPVYASPNDDNGYDISDYRAIMKEFGTMEDFDRMLAKAHSLGIRIVMDLVVNHSSDEHQWFIESRSGKENPRRDYYIWRDGKDPAKGGEPGNEPNNWGSCFGGSAWQYDEATNQYYLHLFSKKQPDLNWDNPKVRNEVFDMMDWWCRKGIDGFRMDVINLISKTPGLPDGPVYDGLYGSFDPACATGPHEHEYLKEMNRRVLSKYDLLTVGETGGVTVEQAKDYAGFDTHELTMVFQFEHTNLVGSEIGKWTTKKPPMPGIRKVFTRWQTSLEGKAWNSLYLGNHDQPRCVSRYGNDKEYRELSAKMLATCLHMMKGSVYVYEGDELGMTNYPFRDLSDFRDIESLNAYKQYVGSGQVTAGEMMADLQELSRDNARTPMQWDDSPNAGFTTGTPWIGVNPNYTEINAAAEERDPDSVFHYYRQLIALRKQYPVIVYGVYEELQPDGGKPGRQFDADKIWAYTRKLDREQLTIACNWSADEAVCGLYDDETAGEILISNYSTHKKGVLQPYEAIVTYRKA